MHYVIDILAGLPVAAAAIAITSGPFRGRGTEICPAGPGTKHRMTMA
jgi:hypothetical protein